MGGTTTSPCTTCGGNSCSCTKRIKVYTPGKPIQITWEEYTKEWDGLCDGALAVGIPYCVVDGPCPGWYIPTDASQGKASDLVLKREHFGGAGSPFVWDAANCRYLIDLDKLCDSAETVSVAEWKEIGCPAQGQAQGHLLYCGPDGLKRVPINGFVAGLPLDNIPNAGQTCGTLKQLVLVEDGDCQKIAWYSEAESSVGGLRFDETVEGTSVPDETGGLRIPNDMPDPGVYYLVSDFRTDGAAGAANFDEQKISSKVILAKTFDNPCARVLEMDIQVGLARYGSVQEAYDRLASIGYRYRVDGGAWVYPRNGIGDVLAFGAFNAVATQHEIENRAAFPAGEIELQFFWMAVSEPPAQLIATTVSTAVPTPRAQLRPAL